jgi:hypothetical protein
MRQEINNDNLYKEGTIICAKKEPATKLLIDRYRQRIYYCSVAGHPDQNNLAYFESELIPPYSLSREVKFLRINAPEANEKQRDDGFIRAPKWK